MLIEPASPSVSMPAEHAVTASAQSYMASTAADSYSALGAEWAVMLAKGSRVLSIVDLLGCGSAR